MLREDSTPLFPYLIQITNTYNFIPIPYTAANTISLARFRVNIQKTRQERPEKNADGVRRLKRPRESERYAGAMRPKTPPAART
ncbi:hypothetical protein H2248_007793 [Termitomyces sp. 'cryptogamus']|nr:hypothetical protein H2248_007793 [Termitomyces sp. 'cryptogamus']